MNTLNFKIKNWMRANIENSLLYDCNEASPTLLAEDCANNSGLVDPNVLDDETHIIWDIAVDVAEWWEAEQESERNWKDDEQLEI